VADSFAIDSQGASSCPPARDLPVADPEARTLFLREARKHDRLIQLIRTGTPTPRPRATSLLPPSAHAPAGRTHSPPERKLGPASGTLLVPPTRLARSHSASALA
jgi:hypothetical protein